MPDIVRSTSPVSATFVTTQAEPALVNEQVLGTAVNMSGTLAARPAFGVVGRHYYATDNFILYRDTGAAWVAVGTSDHGGLAGVLADQHHAQAHTVTSHSTRAHAELTGIGADDHHATAHTHASHTAVGADDHHATAHPLSGAPHTGTLAHSALSSILADDHHVRTEAKAGTSDASGNFAATWTTAFASTPVVMGACYANQVDRGANVTSRSTTGATVNINGAAGIGVGAMAQLAT